MRGCGSACRCEISEAGSPKGTAGNICCLRLSRTGLGWSLPERTTCPCLSRSQFMVSCSAWLVSPSRGGDARASCVTPTPPGSTSSLHGALLPAACSRTAPWLTSSIFLSSHHLIPPPGCCSSPRAFGGSSQRLGLGTAPAVLFLGSCQGLAFSEGQEDNAPSILPVSEGLAVVFSPQHRVDGRLYFPASLAGGGGQSGLRRGIATSNHKQSLERLLSGSPRSFQILTRGREALPRLR